MRQVLVGMVCTSVAEHSGVWIQPSTKGVLTWTSSTNCASIPNGIHDCISQPGARKRDRSTTRKLTIEASKQPKTNHEVVAAIMICYFFVLLICDDKLGKVRRRHHMDCAMLCWVRVIHVFRTVSCGVCTAIELAPTLLVSRSCGIPL